MRCVLAYRWSGLCRCTLVAASLVLCTLLFSCAPKPDHAFVAAVRNIEPSVVLLTMRLPSSNTRQAPYDNAYATGTVVASGPWGSDILTVDHAVRDGWDMHATIDNHRVVPAYVVAQDAHQDIALVRTPVHPLPVARLGSSANLQLDVGRQLGLVGYPIPDEFHAYGLNLATSLNSGRLSSVRNGMLEVTLPIVPGESGSPIFLADSGEIIGIAESRFDTEHSIGFALPSDLAKAFLHRVDAIHGF